MCLAISTATAAEACKATLRLESKPQGGRLTVPLAGTSLVLAVAGGPRLQVTVDEPLTGSKSWKVRKVGPARRLTPLARWEQRYYVEPLGKPGDTLELEVSLRFQEPGQAEQKASWKLPVCITTEIRSVTLDNIRPVTGPEQVPPAWSWWPTVAWIEVGLSLAVLGLILAELVGRRWRRTAVLTPQAWAFRELDRLAAVDLSQAEAVERFPTQVSDVVRRYLELRFRVQASRQTTVEFLQMMERDAELAPDQKAILRDFLQRCDLAKFARATLSLDECRALSASARTFVEHTSPNEPPG
jgi:hypothetical protein